MPKQTNPLRRIINVTSISLSIFTILFSASIMMSLNFGYSSFGTFILFSIRISTIIWFFTLQIYLLMICVKCIWKKSSFYRQQLSSGIISFFLSNFLICTYFMFGNAIPSGSILIGLGLGFGLPLSFCLVISGIIAMIVYQSKKLKLFFSFLSLIGCIGFLFILWFYLINGYDMKINVIIPLERYPDNLTNDPSLNGNYSYKCLTYGSGYDHRIDYESKVTIQTPTIDLSSLIRISSFNKRYFQFNESNLPLNGRIWYPITHTNRYPIVLMVHGNHLSTESSEYGYDYLCQMLASQGFFCLSIDENYLNSGLFTSTMEYGRISSIKKYLLTADYAPEYLARAIILLETLKQIRLWNKNSTNPFYQKLDLTNIALMGHSRGGQAIVIAYLLNKLKYLPEYPSDILLNNYHFSIKGLFSIGGADDGYMPLGRSLTLSNVNLFAIHGIYDGDVVEFSFQSTMTNFKLTSRQNEYYFKSSLYVHQANHGQFNSDWGKYDHSPGTNKYLNIR